MASSEPAGAPSPLIPGAEVRIVALGGKVFTAHEMGRGPLVLFLHGFPDGPATWRHVLPRVAAAGYRAVAVTLRGYEQSTLSDPDHYRLAPLATDAIAWIDALGEERAHLVAHDWGATIAYAASVASPDRVRSLTMVSVPHPLRLAERIGQDKAQMKRSSYMVFFQLKGVSDWWVGRGAAAFVERLWKKWSPGWTPDRVALQDARERMSQSDIRTAALTYYRLAMDRSSAATPGHILLAGSVTAPTLGIVGERDACIAADVFLASMTPEDFPGGLSVHTVAEAGHFVQLEREEAFSALLLGFLGRTGS